MIGHVPSAERIRTLLRSCNSLKVQRITKAVQPRVVQPLLCLSMIQGYCHDAALPAMI